MQDRNCVVYKPRSKSILATIVSRKTTTTPLAQTTTVPPLITIVSQTETAVTEEVTTPTYIAPSSNLPDVEETAGTSIPANITRGAERPLVNEFFKNEIYAMVAALVTVVFVM